MLFLAAALVLVAAAARAGDAHPSRLCADLTADGYVSATDALSALLLAVANDYRAEGDVIPDYGDGRVGATDALAILDASLADRVPPCALAAAGRAIVSNASCDFGTGGVAELSVTDFSVVERRVGATDADAVVRVLGERVFMVNRFDGSSVQEIDPHDALRTLWRCSVGAGSNPHDVVLVSPTKAYVTRYDAESLAIVDPSVGPSCDGFVTGSIDLSGYADADGLPEMDQMVLAGDKLFVSIQRLNRDDFFRPGSNGALVAIDVATDAVRGVVELAISNPFTETKGLVYDERAARIYVGGPGTLFSDLGDGGIEVVDAAALESLGMLLDGGDLGGDLLDFAVVGSRRAYAIVADETFVAHVVELDLEAGIVGEPILSSSQNVSDLEATPDGKLWIVDRDCFDPGVRVFSIASRAELTLAPIYPGLTPFTIDFIAATVDRHTASSVQVR
jgi:hypothetical protein